MHKPSRLESAFRFRSLARWLSWLEQTAHTRQVGGSSPLLATLDKGEFSARIFMARWLSWLEQTAHTRQVGGSSPLLATFFRRSFQTAFFLMLWRSSHRVTKKSSWNAGRCGVSNPAVGVGAYCMGDPIGVAHNKSAVGGHRPPYITIISCISSWHYPIRKALDSNYCWLSW